jgi:HemK-related putative methylase
MNLMIAPEVFDGVLCKSGEFFARALDGNLISPGACVLDMGTGSGILAIRAAQMGASVMAVDINSDAVRCARINIILNRVENRVEVREGDLYAPVAGRKFDRILFNPPFYRQAPNGRLDAAWRSPDVFDRFLSKLDEMLAPNGCALILLSSRGDLLPALEKAGAGGWAGSVVASGDLLHEVLTLYRLERNPDSRVIEESTV